MERRFRRKKAASGKLQAASKEQDARSNEQEQIAGKN
jgi:hypothetical protein